MQRSTTWAYNPSTEVEAFRTYWRTDNEGESADNQIRLPLMEAGRYDIAVDWGDGTADTIDAYDHENATHSYEQPGEYEVTIDGTLMGWAFFEDIFPPGGTPPTTDATKILEIRLWGGLDVGVAEPVWTYTTLPARRTDFRGAEHLAVTAADTPVIGRGARLSWLFAQTGVTWPGLSEWDVSGVEDMAGMFYEAESFDGDVSEWDVSNVETMSRMFEGAESFVGDVSEWDVSNVTDMYGMFDGSGLSTANYDRILTSWQQLDLEDGVEFSAGDTQYSSGEPAEARQQIIDEYGWEISDGGVAE